MKYLLTETERRAVRANLWARVKTIPAPRKVRELILEQVWNEWYANFLRKNST